MSLTDEHDEAAEPSHEIAVREEVQQLRAELEAIRVAATARPNLPVSRNTIDEWVLVVRDYNLLAQSLAKTDFVPRDFKGKPDQITATMMYGREIGLQPMTTLQNTHVIHGRVGMYAEQLRAMILAAGHEYEIEESTSDRCVISGRRKGSDRWVQHEYTMDRAKLAGLYVQNEQYRKRPTEMLLARASGIMAHAQFPDVIRGMAAVEEMEDAEGGQPDNAPVEPAAKATAQVGRKKAAPKAVEGPKDFTGSPGRLNAAEGVSIPEESLPPLPGEGVASPVSSAGETPGEGQATPVADPAEPYRGSVDDVPQPSRREQCPHISNGQQCEWASGHPGRRHSYDDPHEPLSEGDGSPDDVAATGTDEAYGLVTPDERHCPDYDNAHPVHEWQTDDDGAWVRYTCPGVSAVQSATSAPLDPSTVVPLSKAQTAMLQSRFKQMGFTDEPEDREARLAIASRILGRTGDAAVETFRQVDPGKGGMSKDEASRVIRALAPCRDKGAVVEMLAKLEQDRADAEEAQSDG